MSRSHPREVSDALWERGIPLIPPPPSHARGGRPRMPDRQAFAAIVSVLRTGIQWNALPRALGASSTIHDRFQGCFLSAVETVANACVISSSKSCVSSHPTLKRMKPSGMASPPQRARRSAVV
jgi:transposase